MSSEPVTPNGSVGDMPGTVVRAELVENPEVLGTLTRAEIDTQISTAKRYPRSITNFKRDTMEMACIDQKTAQSMFYSLPRAGKNIVGPSIRMAEIVMATWGNLRVECRMVDYNRQTHVVTVEAACWDLEKNSAVKIQKHRKAQSKKGTNYPDADMINLATNAALSVALRDAIFRIVPKAYVNAAFEQAKKVAIGEAKSMKETVNSRIETASKMGVSKERFILACEVDGVDDIGPEEIIYIDGLMTSIRAGEITVEEAFPEVDAKQQSEKLKEAIKKPKAAKKEKEQQEEKKEDEAPKTEEKPNEPEKKDEEPEKPKSEGEAPDWFEKRKAMYNIHTNIDRMRLPIAELVKEWGSATDDDKQWWSALIDDATTHLLGLCKKVSVVPLAGKLLEDALKGYDKEEIASLLDMVRERQNELK